MSGTRPAGLRLSTNLEVWRTIYLLQFGEDQDGRSQSVFDLFFADDYVRIDWQYKETKGWYQAANSLTEESARRNWRQCFTLW